MDGVDSIQSGINLQWITTPPRIQSKWAVATYQKKYISQVHNKKHGKYDPNMDLKTCDHILFEMIGSIFCPYFRGLICLRYMDSNVKKKTAV